MTVSTKHEIPTYGAGFFAAGVKSGRNVFANWYNATSRIPSNR